MAAIAGLFPDADVFTHAYRPEKMEGLFDSHRVNRTFIGRLPLGNSHPQAYLPLMPLAARSLDLDGYDLIISSESGPVKGIRKPYSSRHICYCHTPMRYLWDMHDEYYRSASCAGKLAMALFSGYLRREDLKSADSVDLFVANSAFVAERIKRIYKREAKVVHPPVDFDFYSGGPAPVDAGLGEYYLYAGEIRHYKRPDLAVDACMKLGRRLVVAGDGKSVDALKKRIGGKGDVVFTGRVTDDRLRSLYKGAKALLFPGVEDFGIVPVEAQAAGTPVVAFACGGALETVQSGKTGCFFDRQETDSLCAAIEEFEARAWDPEACRSNASRFSLDAFNSAFSAVLEA